VIFNDFPVSLKYPPYGKDRVAEMMKAFAPQEQPHK